MKKRGKTLKWIVIAFVAIVIIGAAIGGNKKDEVTRTNSSNESSKQQSEGANAPSDSDAAEELVFAMGETAELKDVQVTMTNVFESQGSDFNKPSDGNTFVLVETKNPVFLERLPRECRNNQEINDFSTLSGTTFRFCFCNKNMAIL